MGRWLSRTDNEETVMNSKTNNEVILSPVQAESKTLPSEGDEGFSKSNIASAAEKGSVQSMPDDAPFGIMGQFAGCRAENVQSELPA